MNSLLLSPLFTLIIFSCGNTLEEKKQLNMPSPAISFECDYSAYKTSSKNLFIQYKKHPDSINKRLLLNNLRDSLFRCWLGTPWDFYGTTEEPGKG